MLKLLSISNFAVVSEASLELGPGLNLLTGETGSGKSIFVDSLGLLLGGRGSAEIVRSGQECARIQGVFGVEGNRDVIARLVDAGIPFEDEIIVRREVTERGRSRAFINDQIVTIGLLKALQPFLVDIHGQGDQQSLLDSDSHRELLDEFAGARALRSEVGAAYAAFADARRERERLIRSESDRLRRIDILAFQISEIEAIAPVVDERERLDAERRRLANLERIRQLTGESYNLLYDDEASVLRSLATVARRLTELAPFDSRFEPYEKQLADTKFALEDLAYFLRDFARDEAESPERLDQVERRLVELDRLERKYDGSIAAVLESLEEMRGELETLQDSSTRAETIAQVETETKTTFLEKAHQLRRMRKSAADRLAARVMAELGELAMANTVFEVAFADVEDNEEQRFTEAGIDGVEFLVATNPGEEPRSLAKIASGGEVSRLMLALKTVAAPPEIPRTLVFDEVDVGIGGRVAEAVGQRLSRLGDNNQVLCVTHQAQIARFADDHFTVFKETVDDRAETSIAHLDRKGRVEELARMIGGADISETARKHARELLKARDTAQVDG